MNSNGFEKITSSLLFLLLAALVLLLGWAAGRGFDITDEGFYLLASRSPREVATSASMYYFYTAILFKFVKYNIIWFRFAGVLLALLSAFLFASGIAGMMRLLLPGHRLPSSLAMVSVFSGLGALLYYVWLPLAPSYNALNAFFLTSSAGLLFLALSAGGTDRFAAYRKTGLLCLSGAMIGGAFFTKFPTGIALLLLYVTVLVLWPSTDGRYRILSAAWLAVGFAFWMAFHFLIIQPPGDFLHVFTNALAYMKVLNTGYDPGLLLSYLQTIGELSLSALRFFWLFFLIVLAAFWAASSNRGPFAEPSRLSTTVLLLVLAAAAWSAYRGFAYAGFFSLLKSMKIYTAWLFLLIVLSVLSTWRLRWSQVPETRAFTRKTLLTILLLMPLPLAGAAGTRSPIYFNMIANMAPWFGLFFILFGFLAFAHKNRWILLTGILFLSIVVAVQVGTGIMKEPYGLNAGMDQQNTTTALGYPATELKLDSATNAFFITLQRAATECGLRPGGDVLAFSNTSGIVYALGGISPGIPWYTYSQPDSRAANEFLLSLVENERRRTAFILFAKEDEHSIPDFSKFGLVFPSHYTLCRTSVWPVTKKNIQLWKPVDKEVM